jgi:hypothetical protein
MRTCFTLLVHLGVGALAAACTNPGARESTLRGTTALSTFQAAPTAVTARDEAGNIARATVDPQGQFAIPLAKGHTYHIAVETAGGAVPLVFPRTSGRLDATFVLKTNGAVLTVGQVRHFAGVPSGGFHVLSSQVPSTSAPAPGGETEVGDGQQVTCDGSDSNAAPTNPASDTAEQADASGDLAVGDQNVPEEVAGCDLQEGDNVQQEGEH